MPTYEYQCFDCNEQFERTQKISEDPISECPACAGTNVKRLISATAFHLKGTGWYKTDYASSNGGSSCSSKNNGGSASGTESGNGSGSSSETADSSNKESNGSAKTEKKEAKDSGPANSSPSSASSASD